MSRTRFAALSGACGALLLAIGLGLEDHDGLLGLLAIVCIALGIGLGVAAIFIALRRNPFRRTSGDDDTQ